MSVYYVHAPDLGLVKIGHAVDPRARLSQLQTHSPTRLVLLAVEAGDTKVESARHGQFAKLRKRGEWFSYDGALKAFIATLPPYVHHLRREPLPGPIGAWIFEKRLSQEDFAKLIGTTGATVSRICHGKIHPSKFIHQIFVATNGEVDANALFGLTPDLLNKAEPAEAAA